MSNCTTPYTRFPFLCGNKKAKTVCLGLIVFLERVTGLQICCANLNPRNRRLLRRFPKNVPLARFLHGNPPHRFDSLYLVEIKKNQGWLSLVERSSGAGDGNRTRVTSLEGWSSTIELHPQTNELNNSVKIKMVGMTGFEPATSCSQSRRATKLRHIPTRR